MAKTQVGEVISQGYVVRANYNNEVVLAEHPNKEVPEPFVVWYLDKDGDTFGGSYSKSAARSQKEFIERSFQSEAETKAPQDVEIVEILKQAFNNLYATLNIKPLNTSEIIVLTEIIKALTGA